MRRWTTKKKFFSPCIIVAVTWFVDLELQTGIGLREPKFTHDSVQAPASLQRPNSSSEGPREEPGKGMFLAASERLFMILCTVDRKRKRGSRWEKQREKRENTSAKVEHCIIFLLPLKG